MAVETQDELRIDGLVVTRIKGKGVVVLLVRDAVDARLVRNDAHDALSISVVDHFFSLVRISVCLQFLLPIIILLRVRFFKVVILNQRLHLFDDVCLLDLAAIGHDCFLRIVLSICLLVALIVDIDTSVLKCYCKLRYLRQLNNVCHDCVSPITNELWLFDTGWIVKNRLHPAHNLWSLLLMEW